MEYVPGEDEEKPEPRTTSVYTSMTRKLKEEGPKKSEAEVSVTDKDEVDKGRGVSCSFFPSFPNIGIMPSYIIVAIQTGVQVPVSFRVYLQLTFVLVIATSLANGYH